MRVLVTGANGYLGRGIVKQLLNNGHDVVAADFITDKIDRRATVQKCDLFKIENPYSFFGEPEVLLHLAWRDGFVHYSDNHIKDLPLHYQFLQRIIEGGIEKVAVMGSMHEIGFFEGSIKEDTPCNPLTPYGISKNALRQLTKILAQQKGIAFQWLRGFYIVGNTRYGSSVFSKIVAAAEDGQSSFPFTLGQNQFDFIDYKDFCYQVAAAIEQNTIQGVINICSGYPEKLADRAERFIRENNYHIKLEYGAFPDRPYDSKAIWGDGAKIQQIIKNKTDKNI